eukprot:4164276-Lingulodinium_polyedra.AAC.1
MDLYGCSLVTARSHWRAIEWDPPAGRRQSMPPVGPPLFEMSVVFDLTPCPNPIGGAGDGT